jgi:hypothetical protein
MECIEGWFVESRDGITFRLVINGGHYPGIKQALRSYNGPWYAIVTTGTVGTEKEIINSINDKHRVQIDAKWNEEELSSFQVIDNDGDILFSSEDIRVFDKRVYKM